MSTINISGKEPIDDPEYRYKMPRLMGKVEGRGNGIKTAVVNMRDVANALHRPPDEVTKFFGCELGAQTNWVDATDKSIVNGAHTDAVLQQLLHKYIDIFVLCPNCHLPESNYKIKGGIIYHSCLACGARESADMTHKLATFILNKHKKEKKDKSKDKDKTAKKAAAKDAANGGDDEKKAKKDKKDKKEKKEKKEKKDKKDKKKDAASSPDSEEGSENASDEDDNGSAERDGDAAAGGIGSGSDDDEFEAAATLDNLEVDDAGAFDNCVASIRRYMDDDVSNEQLLEELRTAQTFSAFPIHYRIHLYVAALLQGKSAVTQADIAAAAPVFELLQHNVSDQRHTIGAFELLAAVRAPALRRFFPVILKLLYDADVLEEEAILSWAQQGHNSEYTPPAVSSDMVDGLIAEAKPFLDWLHEADVESGASSGDDDDDEEEED